MLENLGDPAAVQAELLGSHSNVSRKEPRLDGLDLGPNRLTGLGRQRGIHSGEGGRVFHGSTPLYGRRFGDEQVSGKRRKKR